MTLRPRWDRCIYSRGEETTEFVAEYFGQTDRSVLLIGAVGFDPRSTAVPELLSAMGERVWAVLLQEERVGAPQELIERAQVNSTRLSTLIRRSTIARLEIFAADGAVVGSRAATKLVSGLDLKSATDVIVDLSALSKGVAFPVVKHLLARAQQGPSFNLHLVVVDDPSVDNEIVAVGSDRAGMMHGFRGGWGLDENSQAAKLWLPQLISSHHAILDRIHSFVEPHDVCPILPFP